MEHFVTYHFHRDGYQGLTQTSKMKSFIKIVKIHKTLNVATKRSILGVAPALDSPLKSVATYAVSHIITESTIRSI